ncbi:nicotinamide riboside transporter PnuC [Shewanella eurypsychrophilus]|uniref:Nicotinamide riboside transporter PnuC n=1 Tax=Shewanella eurypsychrophilus TaxID=2593656 RepID=A0ABX6V4R7_9GAMM|nr:MULTISPECIES: nicotinamide riboside transporter PnuC [Shewanella]QFU22360.1 nicotinamide riboside transporter PnuC [Shewanella sp. YLB-09]QPG57647.1 nicotinamide riboside transporter PnuC [Shewanella eurypsychrophilus]
MMDFWSALLSTIDVALIEATALTAWEAIAVVLAAAYLVLAMKGSIWCWVAAFASTAIYTALFWKVSLLMESVLNVYYMAMAVYGFNQWTKGRSGDAAIGVISWSLQRHVKLISVTAIISVVVGYLMSTYTQASFAYLDAATTCFAVMTTYLVAKKVLENWLYWVVIDFVSIYLYLQKGLMLTSLLFIMYVGMAIGGYFLWRTAMSEQVKESRA